MVPINYWLAWRTKPGEVTPDWRKDQSSESLLEMLETTEEDPQNKECRLCHCERPARAHHCRRCNRCILRMDHHCPWIYNCVGFGNQGHFVRLLIYLAMLCTLTLILILMRLYALVLVFDNPGSIAISQTAVIISGINLTILVPLASIIDMLTYNQLRLVLLNITTIEDLEIQDNILMGAPVANPYNMGWLKNTKAILGSRVWLWWAPQAMEGDGKSFHSYR
ncbi:hypothetical protein BSLG_008505 [Batrachochytrium salamandrivorans]|nr:hypothetical protein BASA81_004355 [Batrachochytrium salamandrivorans]KAJ1332878.1 hypothetical protein BSLG_008505 [Batrachochytrium salamandrivorans]